MSRLSFPSIVLTIAICAALAAGLSACGGGGSSKTSSTTASTPSTSSTSTGSASSAVVEAFLTKIRSELKGQPHITPAVSNCIIDTLRGDISDADVAQIINSGGKTTSKLQQEATEAGRTCELKNG